VEASGYQPTDANSLSGLTNHPVVNVTWHDAIAYCRWLTERLREWEGTPEPLATLLCKERWQITLPSEAEWEKAARGVEGLVYPWGNEWREDHANTEEVRIGRPSAVGCFPRGASPYGCLDMAGNVWEWTRSVYGRYPYPANLKGQAEREDLTVGNNQERVRRGGSYWDDQRFARCVRRLGDDPSYRDFDYGFRIVVRPCLPSDL